MSSAGHNHPPVELTDEEAQFVLDVLDRDLQQSLAIVQMTQEGTVSVEAAQAAVAYSEAARPIWRKLKEHLNV